VGVLQLRVQLQDGDAVVRVVVRIHPVLLKIKLQGSARQGPIFSILDYLYTVTCTLST
jgi:hypothetical protein